MEHIHATPRITLQQKFNTPHKVCICNLVAVFLFCQNASSQCNLSTLSSGSKRRLFFCININTQVSTIRRRACNIFPRKIETEASKSVYQEKLGSTRLIKAVSDDNKVPK